MARRWRAVVLCALVVLSGCGALIGEGAPASTATPAPVPNGTAPAQVHTPTETPSLGVDRNATWRRLERMLGMDAERPTVVPVELLSYGQGDQPLFVDSPFYRLLGVGETSATARRVTVGFGRSPVAVRPFPGTLHLETGRRSPAALERNLVYGYLLHVQLREGWPPSSYDPQSRTRDGRFVDQALSSGVAAYVTDRYLERFDIEGRTRTGLLAANYRRGSTADRLLVGPQLLGVSYARETLASPRNLSALYRSPPRTTEQLVHGETAASEPPAALAVSVSVADEWNHIEAGRQGEFATRTALEATLPADRASRAAAGWGEDSLHWVATRDVDDRSIGFVWTTRWDAARDADEFERALAAVVRERESATPAQFRVRRLDDRTVALIGGNESVLDTTSVSGTGGNVTVTVASPPD